MRPSLPPSRSPPKPHLFCIPFTDTAVGGWDGVGYYFNDQVVAVRHHHAPFRVKRSGVQPRRRRCRFPTRVVHWPRARPPPPPFFSVAVEYEASSIEDAVVAATVAAVVAATAAASLPLFLSVAAQQAQGRRRQPSPHHRGEFASITTRHQFPPALQ